MVPLSAFRGGIANGGAAHEIDPGDGQPAQREVDQHQGMNARHLLPGFGPVCCGRSDLQAPKGAEIQKRKNDRHQESNAQHQVPAHRRILHAYVGQQIGARQQQNGDADPDGDKEPVQNGRQQRQPGGWRQLRHRDRAQCAQHERHAAEPDHGGNKVEQFGGKRHGEPPRMPHCDRTHGRSADRKTGERGKVLGESRVSTYNEWLC